MPIILGQIDKAAKETGIAYLEAVRRSILESSVGVREHVKTDDKGNFLSSVRRLLWRTGVGLRLSGVGFPLAS